MAYLGWDERMCVGHETIDGQHRRLVGLINELAEAAARGAGRRDIGLLIRAFCDYAAEHFLAEQGLMDSTDYPEYFQQVEGHEACSAQALDFYRQYINGGEVAGRDFLAYVSTWFLEHTLGVDQTLRGYLQKKSANANKKP
ncbi:MAG: hemerythrin family protein [Humidesulfovibrio sp.]|nr:hemerythrin family protein [Humidesulfovibrio sp.]